MDEKTRQTARVQAVLDFLLEACREVEPAYLGRPAYPSALSR